MKKKPIAVFRYLYAYPSNIFNGDTPIFELEPLQGSDVTRAVIFAGKNIRPFVKVEGVFAYAISYLYLETDKKPDVANVYKNVHLYERLLCLVSGKPAGAGNLNSIDVSKHLDFESITKEYLAEEKEYNMPGVQHHGSVKEYNATPLFVTIVRLVNRMKPQHKERAERALATFIIAEEIGMTVNPQTKGTVRASLYLSAINQLADSPQLCHYSVINECAECHKKNIQHQKTSHPVEIEKLMRELFTGSNLENGIKLIKENYNKVRSPFLHEGKLSGGENEGGWIADDPANQQFFEDLINFESSCRQLIELYIQKRATESNQGEEDKK